MTTDTTPECLPGSAGAGLITLQQAQDWLEGELADGEQCPCCGQFAKLYRRKLNHQMAAVLIKMWRASTGTPYWDGVWDGEYVNIPALLMHRHADEAKLACWGLIEEAPEKRPDGGRSGWWKVTEKGARFARGFLWVPRYALIYDGLCKGLEGPLISVQDALGDRFSYQELMHS